MKNPSIQSVSSFKSKISKNLPEEFLRIVQEELTNSGEVVPKRFCLEFLLGSGRERVLGVLPPFQQTKIENLARNTKHRVLEFVDSHFLKFHMFSVFVLSFSALFIYMFFFLCCPFSPTARVYPISFWTL